MILACAPAAPSGPRQYRGPVAECRGLAPLMSALLVAYTIEYDYEFERYMPHGTTQFGPGGPEPGVSASGKPMGRTWLASQESWSNRMRYLPRDGVPAAELAALPGSFSGLERWGYVVTRPGAQAGAGPAAPIICPTRNGIRAQAIWSRLDEGLSVRWERRFGAETIDRLRAGLAGVARPAAESMPFYLPMVYYADGMPCNWDPAVSASGPRPVFEPPDGDLSVLLSRALLAFTLDYERDSELSLAIGANTLRALDSGGVGPSEIPRLTGTSKEAVASSVGFLARRGFVTVAAKPSGRGKMVRLTARGNAAQAAYGRVSEAVEAGWRDRFGAAAVDDLVECLRCVVGHQTEGRPTLALGLEPPPDGWRARPPYAAQTRAMLADPAAALPYYPMILHRGSYPDGS